MQQAVLTRDKEKASGYFDAKNLIIAAIVLVVSGFFFLPVVILVLAGLIPALVASIIDDDRHRSLTTCVFLSNMAGVLPFAVELIQDGFDIAESFMILTRPTVWLGILVAASVGWGLYLFIPPIVIRAVRAKARMKIASIEAKQRKLVELWGPEVMPPAYRHQPDQKQAS